MKTGNFHFFIILLVFCNVIVGCGERYYQGKDSIPEKDLKFQPANPTSTNTSKGRFKEIRGKVIKISDGDTFSLIFENNFEVKIRLDGIDAPERKQAYSTKAKEALSNLIYGKEVKVIYKAQDRYGRVLGSVYNGNICINHEMIKKGFAWHFKKYSDDPVLAKLEEEAKNNQVGLWANPGSMPPWEFRK